MVGGSQQPGEVCLSVDLSHLQKKTGALPRLHLREDSTINGHCWMRQAAKADCLGISYTRDQEHAAFPIEIVGILNHKTLFQL